jgi:hypothetical protein
MRDEPPLNIFLIKESLLKQDAFFYFYFFYDVVNLSSSAADAKLYPSFSLAFDYS